MGRGRLNTGVPPSRQSGQGEPHHKTLQDIFRDANVSHPEVRSVEKLDFVASRSVHAQLLCKLGTADQSKNLGQGKSNVLRPDPWTPDPRLRSKEKQDASHNTCQSNEHIEQDAIEEDEENHSKQCYNWIHTVTTENTVRSCRNGQRFLSL